MPDEPKPADTALRDWLQNIVDVYEAASELFTSDADLAASMYDRARAALNGKPVRGKGS